MVWLHIFLYVLLSAGLVFAIIELGLAAAVTSFMSDTQQVGTWNIYSGYSYENVHVSAPPILDFLLFTAAWTILIAALALVSPWFFSRKGNVAPKRSKILGIVLAVVYFVTMVFWLAGFADIVTLMGGYTSDSEYLNAVIALAVLQWLVFLALFILTVLALVGVLVSNWPGYQSLRGVQQEKSIAAPAPAPAPAPASVDVSSPSRSVPISSNPAVPSELSSRDAEALHDHSNTPISPSSPSVVNSAELSGDGSHGHHYSPTSHA